MRVSRVSVAVLLILAGLLALPVRAGEAFPQPGAADSAAMRVVIEAQLAAFRSGDEEKAFSLAAPGIRARFGDARRFMTMVREGYAPLLAPRSWRFLEAAIIDGQVIQPLEFVAPDGRVLVALYSMVREAGGWLIAGCELAPSSRVTT